MLQEHHNRLAPQGFHHYHHPNLHCREYRHCRGHKDRFLCNHQNAQANHKFHHYHHPNHLDHLCRHYRDHLFQILPSTYRSRHQEIVPINPRFLHTSRQGQTKSYPIERHEDQVHIEQSCRHAMHLDRFEGLIASRSL